MNDTRPIAEVYAALAQRLWPWDESRCRVCGWQLADSRKLVGVFRCTADCCREQPRPEVRADAPPDLACWAGVGLVVEAMRERGFYFRLVVRPLSIWQAWFFTMDSGVFGTFFAKAEPAWEAVCRAALAALEAE